MTELSYAPRIVGGAPGPVDGRSGSGGGHGRIP
jgi:hypothetical protein